MKYSLKQTEIICFLVSCFLGSVFHFVYHWSGENPVIGLFFPVNESTWEHLKLIFFPLLLTSAVQYFIVGKQYERFICIKFLAALTGMFITVVVFYTYTGVYGKNSEAMNILTYFLAMAATFRFSFLSLKRNKFVSLSPACCYLGFALLTILFAVFTIFPPHIGLFVIL